MGKRLRVKRLAGGVSMSKKSILDSLRVTSPCNEDWDQMKGNSRVRFCSHCAKDVNNISEMTPNEAVRMARKAKGNVCIRYKIDPVTKAPVFAERFHALTRSPIAATGVMAATLALTSAGYSQGEVRPLSNAPLAHAESDIEAGTKKPDLPTAYGSLSGTIRDDQKALLQGAIIKLTNEATQEFVETATDGDGRYEFRNLQSGTYSISAVSSVELLSKRIENVIVSVNRVTTLDMELISEMNVTVGGAISIVVEYKNPLTAAVSSEDIDMVRDLIAAGEDVNAAEEDKTTPIFAAVESGNLEITAALLDFGAKLNVRNEDERTPLMAIDEDTSVALVELLIESGAKVNMTDSNGDTALIHAARSGVKTEVLKALIDAGADVNITNKSRQSALIEAADNGQIESVRLLLIAGANVNNKNDEDETAWDQTGDEEIEALLVSYGAVTTEQEIETVSDEAEVD